MKIGVFGDLHESNPIEIIEEFNDKKVDLILANGDFVSKDNTKLVDLLEKIATNSKSKVVIIPGNHEERKTWKTYVPILEKEYDNLIDNNNKRLKFGSYKIVSIGGGTVKPNYIREIVEMNLNNLPTVDENTILQLHEPPKYYGDLICYNINRGYRSVTTCKYAEYKKYEGHIELTKLIENNPPKLVVAGHIHNQKAQSIPERVEADLSSHLFVNPGAARDGYYAIVEIDEGVTAYLKKIEDNFHKNYYKLFSNL